MAFALIGDLFYIHSGSTHDDGLVQQFYALDLTQSWNTTQPVWISLPPGPYNGYHSAGYSSDNNTFITFGQDTGARADILPNYWRFQYDIQAKTWSSGNPSGLADSSRRDISAVTNPQANQIYILGGDAGVAGTVVSNVFDTYDVATGTLTEITTPPTGPQKAYTYAAVWLSRSPSSMLVIGGQMNGGLAQALWVYNPTTKAWSTQATTGTFAYNRISPCAASNADGSLVAVFGGFIGGKAVADPNVYILNTATWTWTTVAYGAKARGNAACAIVDNVFVIWGGFYDNPSVVNGLPTGAETLLLLDLTSKLWLTTYTPSPARAKNNPGTVTGGNGGNGTGNGAGNGTGLNGSTGSSSGGGKSGISTGAIGGIAAGVLVCLLAAAFLLHRRRNNNKKDAHYTTKNTDFEFTKEEEGDPDNDSNNGNARHWSSQDHSSMDGGRPRRPAPPPGNLSPALYDFDSSPLSQNARLSQQQHYLLQQQHLQELEEQMTPEELYAAQQQQQQYLHMLQSSSPHFSEMNHSNHGYSDYSSPSAMPLMAVQGGGGSNSSSNGLSPFQHQHLQQSSPQFSDASNMYYPPPPGTFTQQQSEQHQQHGYGTYEDPTNGVYPHKVPADEEQSPSSPTSLRPATADQYHDTFGMRHLSGHSDQGSDGLGSLAGFVFNGKRPVSGPQGFYHPRSSTYEPSLGGAPQSIPEEREYTKG
ncbi:hypothetical protein EDD11_009943 [Mortierella claussenii]|nr:hypothetical protein EDD11_009943 [Mortierella claussenii]